MNRRGFIALLAGAGAALAVPELWVPRRTLFLPPEGGWGGGWAYRPSSAVISGDCVLFDGVTYVCTAAGVLTDAGALAMASGSRTVVDGSVVLRRWDAAYVTAVEPNSVTPQYLLL